LKNLLILVTLVTGVPVCAQTLRYSTASHFAGICSDRFTDVFSFSANQASLAALEQVTAGIYAERTFLLTELTQYTGVIGIPVNKGGIGLVMNRYGFSDFNESQIGLAYGKDLGKVNAGIQFNYHMVRIAGYGSDAAVTVELGSTWHISEKLYSGLHIANPVGGKYAKSKEEKIAAVYTAGLGYEASEKLFMSAEIIKEERRPVNVVAGVQYVIAEKLFTRFGVSAVTASPFFGAGWKWKNCRADVTASHHPRLGITPGLMIVFFGKKKEEKTEDKNLK
jgi:hypothetical protein